MVVTLEETKEWLRVESNDEDALIESFMGAAEDIVEGVLRYPLSELESVPETIRQTVIFCVSRLYEERNQIQPIELIESVKGFLYAYRKEAW